ILAHRQPAPQAVHLSLPGTRPCNGCTSSAAQNTSLESASFARKRGIADRRSSWPTCWVTSVLPPLFALRGPAPRHILGVQFRLCNHLREFLTLLKLRQSGGRLRQRGVRRHTVRAAAKPFLPRNRAYMSRTNPPRARLMTFPFCSGRTQQRWRPLPGLSRLLLISPRF